MNTTRLPSRQGSRNTRLSCRKVVWLGVAKKSKKGMQPISHRTPPSSHLSFFRCVPSATPYARSRNFFIIIRKTKGHYAAIYVREGDTWKIRMAYAQ